MTFASASGLAMGTGWPSLTCPVVSALARMFTCRLSAVSTGCSGRMLARNCLAAFWCEASNKGSRKFFMSPTGGARSMEICCRYPCTEPLIWFQTTAAIITGFPCRSSRAESIVSKESCQLSLIRGRCHNTTAPSQASGAKQPPPIGVPHLRRTVV